MNLIILTEKDAVGVNRYRLVDQRADHIRMVLRSHQGDTIEVGLLNGPAGKAIIEHISETEVIVRSQEMKELSLSSPTVEIIYALPRPQTLKKILITSASMGVRRVYLIRANRVEKSYYQSPLLQPEKYTPYLLEGLSQGKLTRLPEVHIFDRFRRFFEDELPRWENDETAEVIKLLPDPDARENLSNILKKTSSHLQVAIGPEGGWVPFETELMAKCGFRQFTLGRWILRVETAIAAVLGQIELVRMQQNNQ